MTYLQVLSCGHRCTLACHAGPCAPISDCKKKVKVTCPCKRRKEEFRCFNVNSLAVPVACDDECAAARLLAEEERRRAAQGRHTEEESEQSRKEAELFEKRQEGGAKRRRRNRRTECAEEEGGSFFTKYRTALLSLAVVATAVISLHFMYNTA
jgi:hypothetical protein